MNINKKIFNIIKTYTVLFLLGCIVSSNIHAEEFTIKQTTSEFSTEFTLQPISDTGTWVVIPHRNFNRSVENILKKEEGIEVVSLKNVNTIIIKGKNVDIINLRQSLLNDNLVKLIEPDTTISVFSTPNDPLYSQQWDMEYINMPFAWGVIQGFNDLVVAVLDTGIDPHPDLNDNLYVFPDGSLGWECFNGVLQPTYKDYFGHGTHVAGTIAAVGNNGIGVTGINWYGKIMSFAFLGATGSGSLSDAIILIDKIIELKLSGINIKVLNNSWGGEGISPALEESLFSLEKNDILAVAAAGNSARNTDIYPFTPASSPNRGLITVQAHTSTNEPAFFTNYGLVTTDISAPGTAILSTVSTNNIKLRHDSGYLAISGTSMACPHIAGIAALVWSVNPELSLYELKDLILSKNSVLPLQGRGMYSSTSGRVDVEKILNNPLLTSPKTNNIPELILPELILGNAGQTVNITPTAFDKDGDSLTYVIHGQYIPYSLYTSYDLVLPHVFVDSNLEIFTGVSDGNGGTAVSSTLIYNKSDPNWPYADYGVSVTTGLKPFPNTTNFLSMTVYANYDYTTNPSIKTGWKGWICFRGAWSQGWAKPQMDNIPSEWHTLVNANTWVKVFAECLNEEFLLKESNKLIFWTGPDPEPSTKPGWPIINLNVDKVVGDAPFTFNYNAVGSADPNGGLQVVPISKVGVITKTSNLQGSITINEPGLYVVQFLGLDGALYTDIVSKVISVLSPIPNGCRDPIVTTQPVDETRYIGQSVTFNVEVNGTEPFTYQWKFNGTPISGANGSSYTINSVTFANDGYYSVEITNECGSIESNSAGLVVFNCINPEFFEFPVSQTKNIGESVTFTAIATGTNPFTYQWKFNGVPINGATDSVYTINSVTLQNAGNYTIVVSNICGSTESGIAKLTVIDPTPVPVLNQVTNLTAISSGQKIILNWTDNSQLESGYEVWYAIKNRSNMSAYTKISPNLSANSNSYTFTAIPGNTGPRYIYYFKIRAYSNNQFAPFSNITQAKVSR
jgi:subtilisin family serine protease